MDIPAETSDWTDKIELKVSINERYRLYSAIYSIYVCEHTQSILTIFNLQLPINSGPSDYKEWLLMLFVTLRPVQPMVHHYKWLTSSCFRQDLTTFLVRGQKFMENLVFTKSRKMCLTWLPNPQMWNGQHNA